MIGTDRDLKSAFKASIWPGRRNYGQDDDGCQSLCPERPGGRHGPLLVAARVEASLAAGEGNEHLVVAVPAADSGKAKVQIAATEESVGNLADDRPPRAVTLGVTLAVGALELREVTLDGSMDG